MDAPTKSCPEDSISQNVFPSPGMHSFCLLFCDALELGRMLM